MKKIKVSVEIEVEASTCVGCEAVELPIVDRIERDPTVLGPVERRPFRANGYYFPTHTRLTAHSNAYGETQEHMMCPACRPELLERINRAMRSAHDDICNRLHDERTS